MKKEYWKFGRKGQDYYTLKITDNDGKITFQEDLMPEDVPEEARGQDYYLFEEKTEQNEPILEKEEVDNNETIDTITVTEEDIKDLPVTITEEEVAAHSISLDKPEMVNHPKHYGGDTTYECIKVLHNWMNKDEYFGFCKGNALKYLCRAGQKDETKQELQKAVWYINKMIEVCNEN